MVNAVPSGVRKDILKRKILTLSKRACSDLTRNLLLCPCLIHTFRSFLFRYPFDRKLSVSVLIVFYEYRSEIWQKLFGYHIALRKRKEIPPNTSTQPPIRRKICDRKTNTFTRKIHGTLLTRTLKMR